MSIVIVTGQFGSGKTEIAMELARSAAIEGERTVLLDLDVVNPYFTSSAHCDELGRHGIKVVSPVFANTNVDVPAISGAARAALLDKDAAVIVDLGGDAVGAAVLGSMADALGRGGEAALLLAVNVYRPFTQTPETIIKLIDAIQTRARLAVTGLINNANLLEQTNIGHLHHGEAVLSEVAKRTGIPVAYHSGTQAVLAQEGSGLSGIPLVLTLRSRAPGSP
jgi:hypothetical protein